MVIKLSHVRKGTGLQVCAMRCDGMLAATLESAALYVDKLVLQHRPHPMADDPVRVSEEVV